MTVAKDKVVHIDYKLTNAEGQVLDTSEGRAPLAYLHGHGQIIPGLESALEGKQEGDALNVTIEPKDAYGETDDAMIQPVPRENFPKDVEIQPGMRFNAQTDAGTRQVTVLTVTDKEVTIDANHPLAGETLNFDVKIKNVRDASAEEKEHGHAHGPGGAH